MMSCASVERLSVNLAPKVEVGRFYLRGDQKFPYSQISKSLKEIWKCNGILTRIAFYVVIFPFIISVILTAEDTGHRTHHTIHRTQDTGHYFDKEVGRGRDTN
jgi:hypothetical protein